MNSSSVTHQQTTWMRGITSTFLYAICSVANIVVPKSINSGPVTPLKGEEQLLRENLRSFKKVKNPKVSENVTN